MTSLHIFPPQSLTIEVVGCMAERGAYYVGGGVFHLPRGGRPYREGLADAREAGPAEWLLGHGFVEEVGEDGEPFYRAPGPSRVGVVEPVVAAEPEPARPVCGTCGGGGAVNMGGCAVRCWTCGGDRC